MTTFLPEDSPDQVAPLADRPATGFWDRITAAGKKTWIEADVWNRARVISDTYEAELRDSLPNDPAAQWRRSSGRNRENPVVKRARLFDVIKALKISEPEKYADTPTTEEEFQAQVLKRRRAEYDEQVSILDNAPGDAFAAQTIGELWAGFSDPLSIATLPLGGPEAKGAISLLKSIGIEAAVGGGTELLQDADRQRVAADLGTPAPDTLENMLMGAAGAAGLVGGIHGLARGVGLIRDGAARIGDYRASRGEAAAGARPADLSPGQHEARISTAADALTDGKTPPPIANGLPPITPDAPQNWQAIRGGIFAGESGGDFNALFGFSNRDGGPWSHIKLTEMTVDEAIAFSDPKGDYARWVRARVGRTATPMGAYQIVGTTLREAKKLMGLRGDELMDEAMQERLGQFIYRRQGTGAWEGYRGPRADFQPGESGGYSGGGQSFEPTRRGYTGEGQVAAGDRRIDVEYVVVDASKLQKASGRFQPRDRSRLNSDAWIAETAARLDPAQLLPSPTADRGAPIIGPDMMVESGNGRFAAIQRAYAEHPDRAAAYRQQIEAAGFAIPEGVKEPVLVASRKTALTDAEREQFAVDAQDSGVARMTPTEIARASARAMTAERLASFHPGTAIGDAANRPFLQSVLGDLPRSERNALFDEGGALNAEGKRRVAHAFFARAWDDGSPLGRDVLARYAEAEDAGEMKSLMDALDEAAPAWATLRAEIGAGTVRPEFDITPHVLDALGVIMQARREASRAGGSIADAIDAILDQGDLFVGPNPLSIALLRKFWRDGRAAPPAEIGRFLTRYADEARTAGRTGDMLGASPADALRAIDAKTFADLPDDIPPIGQPTARAIDDATMPETAFAKGADSPEAEAADQSAMEELRGPTDTGPFGPIHRLPEGHDAAVLKGEIDKVLNDKTGEIIGALSHPAIKSKIDLIYGRPPGPGEEGLGLAKIAAKHPEVLPDLQGFLDGLTLDQGRSGSNRIRLSSPDGQAVVRLDFDEQEKTWLLTAFEKKGRADRAATTDTGAAKAPDDTAGRGIGTDRNIGDPLPSDKADEISAVIATARAEFDALGDFELPDGTRASDLLADLDQDQNLLDVLDACLIGGNRQ